MAARRLALLAFAAGAHALAPTPNRRRPARAVAVRSSTNVDKYPAPRRGRSNNFVTSLGLERDKALQALSALDRGEFRWEFLTPWLDRELTRLDKVIVCSAFIGVAIVGQKLLEPQTAISQHLSYIANFFSYTIGNQIGYRVIAILASLLEIFAYGVEDGGFGVREDAIPETYNVLFIVVNLYYVLRWTLNRIDTLGLALLDDTEEQLYERCFEPLGVKPYQYLKLLGNAEWVEPDERVALTIEGEPVRRLFVSIDGDFDVVSGGARVASIPPFQIIGEVALLENLQSADGEFHQASRATVLADPGSSYICWPHETLYELKESDEEFARAMSLAIARTLSHKLGSARAATGKLLEQQAADGDGAAKDLVAVRSVLSPADERLYTSCFLRRGFDDERAFAALMKASRAETAGDSEDASEQILLLESAKPPAMVVLTSGSAEGFVDGLKVQSFAPLQLVGAQPLLENLLMYETQALTARGYAVSAETVVIAPGSTFVSFYEDDVRRAAAAAPELLAALRALYVSETRRARAVPVLASQDAVEAKAL
jgi:CRP-like cAMP-binding protein